VEAAARYVGAGRSLKCLNDLLTRWGEVQIPGAIFT
jgi:hypothetical protein